MSWLYLQQSNSNGKGNACGTERSLPLRNRPGVSLQLPQKVSQVHVYCLHRLQKSKTGAEKMSTTAFMYIIFLRLLWKSLFTSNVHAQKVMDLIPAGSSSVMRGQWFALLSRRGWLHQSQHLLQKNDARRKLNCQFEIYQLLAVLQFEEWQIKHNKKRSLTCICLGVRSFVPRKTQLLAIPSQLSSWT